MTQPHDAFRAGDARLLVNVQKDFCPGGALPVEHGDTVVPVLNDWLAAAQYAGIPIFASRDWHPREHVSFDSTDGSWPLHCVQDTEGASFHRDLRLPEGALIVTKGTRFDKDQYSAFDETGSSLFRVTPPCAIGNRLMANRLPPKQFMHWTPKVVIGR